jgi:hypothetical protein
MNIKASVKLQRMHLENIASPLDTPFHSFCLDSECACHFGACSLLTISKVLGAEFGLDFST